MATQRLTIATLAGRAADAVADMFRTWHHTPDPEAVDRFCLALRGNALSLSVVYFAEWIDRWLMGDTVPGPGACEGRRFRAACFTPERARAWADRCGSQFAEYEWFAARLREASAGWGTVVDRYAVVVVREVVGPSATDEEVLEASRSLPDWLSAP